MSETTHHAPLLGRCKECDFALFATRDQVQDADGFREVKLVGTPYRVGNNGIFARCTNRHKVFVLKTVKGTYSEKHNCDSRCLNAKGHDCTCSCGGANHGRGYAVEVTEASAPVIAQANSDDASDKQIDFITNLINERLDGDKKVGANERLEQGLTKKLASAWIERLLELPKAGE